jgi:LysR family transcriptional regulator, transcription activator of glutamate synthase operon
VSVLDIEQFKYVLAIARYKHFTEASYQMSMSQSSLSKQLSKIECDLGGVRLFDRASRPIKLTAAGQDFLPYAQRIVEEFEALKLAMREYTMYAQDHLVIGTIPIMGRMGLTPLIADFQKKYPKIKLELKERKNKELLELLRRAEIDVAFITAPKANSSEHPEITYYPLVEDDVVLVANESHPLAKRASINLAEAANEVFILVDSASGMYRISLDACHDAGFTPAVIRESRHIDTIIGLVAEGLGVSLLSRRMVRSSTSPNIAAVRLNETVKRVTALAVRNQPHLSVPAKTFINHSLAWKTALSAITTLAPATTLQPDPK